MSCVLRWNGSREAIRNNRFDSPYLNPGPPLAPQAKNINHLQASFTDNKRHRQYRFGPSLGPVRKSFRVWTLFHVNGISHALTRARSWALLQIFVVSRCGDEDSNFPYTCGSQLTLCL